MTIGGGSCGICGAALGAGCDCQGLVSFLRDFRQAASTPLTALDSSPVQPPAPIETPAGSEQHLPFDVFTAPAAADAPGGGWAPPPFYPAPAAPYFAPSPAPAIRALPRPPALMVGAIVAAIVLIAGGGVFWLNRSTGPSITRVSASRALQLSLAAASKAGSVHVAETDTTGGSAAVEESVDSMKSWGEATAYLPQGETDLMINGSTVYIHGDRYGLAQLGFPAGEATSYESKWMTVPPTDDFVQAAQALLMNTILQDVLDLTGPITRVGDVVDQGLTITGHLPSNQYTEGQGAGDLATLVISTQSPYYPLSLRYSDPDDGTTSLQFQHWGQVRSWVPDTAVPMPSLQESPVPAGGPTTVEDPITDTAGPAPVSVDPTEAQSVALRLWNENGQARADGDLAGLQMLDAGPELAADAGYLCQWGCHGPQVQSSQVMVTVPRETTWPAYFFATVPYTTSCTADLSPCDDSFVAVQAAPHAEWKITLLVDWSGTAYVTHAPVPDGQYSPPASPPPGTHLNTLPEEYAAYLQAIKDTGRPPASTRLAPGPFTTDLSSTNYEPLSQQEQGGAVHHVTYTVSPSDQIWQFPGSQGTTAVCGTVRFTDSISPTPGRALVQSNADHPYGNLAVGTYSAVTITGLHMVCFEAYADPSQPVAVLGTWGDIVSAVGTPIAVQTTPT